MRIDVPPGALPAAAQQLVALARDLRDEPKPPPVQGDLQEAVTDFVRAWAHETDRLAEEASAEAGAALVAADVYQQLEQLLIPRALR
jgi:hypothetical protein